MFGIKTMIQRLSAGSGKETEAGKGVEIHKKAEKKAPVKIPVRDLGDPFAEHSVGRYAPVRSPFHEAQRRPTEIRRRREPTRRRSLNQDECPVIKNRDELDKARFVCKAIDRSDNKPYAHVLHVERSAGGSILVATDGKRLHVAEIETKIPEGDYKPQFTKDALICNPENDASFPDWQRVVPDTTKKKGTIGLTMVSGKNADHNRMVIIEACKDIKRMTGAKLDPKFVADLSDYRWDVYASTPDKPLILFETGSDKETYAVIMPILTTTEDTRPTPRMSQQQPGNRRAPQAA